MAALSLSEDVQYYQRLGSLRLQGDNGRPNTPILQVIDALEQAVDQQSMEDFAPLPLDEDLKRHLGVSGLELAMGTWNYYNNSKELSELGVSLSGGVRRECLGDIYIKLDPPREISSGRVRFTTLDRDIGWWRGNTNRAL